MRLKTFITGLWASLVTSLFGAAALAQDGIEGLESIGKPNPDKIGFQPAATELMRDIVWLDNMLLIIITAITLFVTALLGIVIFRYNRRVNPTPATFTHHSTIEVVWTIVPIIILVFIGAFSLPVLFKQQEIPEGDIVIKATGYQWYWGYEYVDEGLEFEAFMLGSKEAVVNAGYAEDEFLLATDNAIIVPTGKTIVIQVTGADVIHSWTIPAFGVKQDAVPGRLAELWFNVDEGMEGIYFGQCSELCGKDHAYMPITLKAVTQEQYEAWLAGPAQEFAIDQRPRAVDVAAAE
ncbi:Cytochrome c oxidase polypeptide II [Candidatus Rhodobacter oscarellae]|uniref:Cytochrome c oxidase subunit 2 n=1 Tax=Candidatus Rhodobacter oscarellae TaxID=1675527 RepID=A0A0J9H1B2_9RHOB|nr:cytochrome c oxidase subunit II [Candidatus Rhodobacter lobularis]KMW59538.1 Cytochrome c oxidase polypeptide II [Candidatus Rhodobacter lobularis]